ncbi:MAG: asparagine synthase (glutamine-hydrolyzing) [Bdellovibrionales bacterium RIFOXYC1_FULL_54_43]|nr:MAG: asparagine synthase (glutamine-hydrolyzing) [Bdellovibrionales bacterium RIFOXYC1_FULL_54_43]OFZ83970.1 MAG: asparagine synthase (glutamine-hydrolyzing) [Bdellovibrionales bacterium RIFOXYD1_FULL_55_31]
MCGIVGAYALGRAESSWSPEQIDRLIQGIRQRGPDATGTFSAPGVFLGHARLSVIDLSATANQPMRSSDDSGRLVITYNGEIYNFRELRQELEKSGTRFRTHSDTEVILAAWQHWGPDCVSQLDGIFAFGIFDRKDQALYLVRDRLGVKPLFYWQTKDSILFASEPLALIRGLKITPELAPEDLDTFFTFNYLPAPRTGFRDIRQLPGGYFARITRSGIKLSQYWKLGYDTPVRTNSASLLEEFQDLLDSSVKAQMVSDAPLGLFLSGGLDSYAVARSAVKSNQSPETYTLSFTEPGFDETEAAKAYADYLHISQTPILFRWDEEHIRETLRAMNELLADASCFPYYQLAKFARRHATVILAGDGGDELLAGYDTYKAGEVTPYLHRLPGGVRSAVRSASQWIPADGARYSMRMVVERLLGAADEPRGRDHASFRRIFPDELKNRLYSAELKNAVRGSDPIGEYANYLREVPETRSYLTARQHADLLFHLPSILAKVDRMSMTHGLEVRVPILSKKLVEFCMSLPDDVKRRQGKGKWILRETLRSSIPPSALARKKAGFLPPVDEWFRTSKPWMSIFDEHLSQASSALDYLDWKEVRQLWQEHQRYQVDAGFALLGIIQFINWGLKIRR